MAVENELLFVFLSSCSTPGSVQLARVRLLSIRRKDDLGLRAWPEPPESWLQVFALQKPPWVTLDSPLISLGLVSPFVQWG